MKRVIIVSMMLVSGLVQAVNDANSKSSKDLGVDVTNVHQVSVDKINVDIENIHQINLDTTEIDGSGNWLNKRIWYERSQTIFDEIRVMLNAIGDLRIQFSNEVNAVGQKIDSFFEVVDFTKGQLDDKFKEILIALDTEQKILGDLSEEERNLQTSVKQEMPAIDQIGKDIKSIGDVDNQIDQTLMQAFKTIDECRDYESKAWDAFKAIARELDDKKARNLYYQMSNFKQNIDQKHSYLKATLLPYLHNVLVAKIDVNIAKINATIEALKTKGIDLEKIMNKSQDDDVAKFHAREKEAVEIAVRKALEEEAIKEQQAAEQAAKALADAEYNSYLNVIHRYYDATVGKAVGLMHQGYMYVSQLPVVQYVELYSYVALIYLYDAMMTCKTYLYNFVESIMHYFGKAQVTKIIEPVAEESEQPVDNLEKKVEVTEENVETIKSEDEEKSDHNAATPSVAAPKETEVDSEIHASVTPTLHSEHEDAKNVELQSIKNTDASQDQTTSFYPIFKTVLDLIGTMFVGLYNCVIQFFKLLINFASYVTSVN